MEGKPSGRFEQTDNDHARNCVDFTKSNGPRTKRALGFAGGDFPSSARPTGNKTPFRASKIAQVPEPRILLFYRRANARLRRALVYRRQRYGDDYRSVVIASLIGSRYARIFIRRVADTAVSGSPFLHYKYFDAIPRDGARFALRTCPSRSGQCTGPFQDRPDC